MRTKAQIEIAKQINNNKLIKSVMIKAPVFTGQSNHAENTLGLFSNGSIKTWDDIAGCYTGVMKLSQDELKSLMEKHS